jgi:hypothetical protein
MAGAILVAPAQRSAPQKIVAPPQAIDKNGKPQSARRK